MSRPSNRSLPFDLSRSLFYEDRDLLVVYKPAGVLTIKDDKGGFNLYSVLYEHVQKEGVRNQKLFVVHRLDKDTSGLLVFAKNIQTKNLLQACFEQHVVERRYEAVTKGKAIPVGKTARLEISLLEDKHHNVFAVEKGRGKECLTYAACLAQKNGYSYLDVSLVTGRRNQIRLSLANIGMPILGDNKYGGEKAKRMYLNAYLLEFPSGVGLKQTRFEIPRSFQKEFGLK